MGAKSLPGSAMHHPLHPKYAHAHAYAHTHAHTFIPDYYI